MPNSSVLTLRIGPKLKKKLEKLAQVTRRSRSFLAAEAIRDYVSLNEWQIAEIHKAMAEADRGEFATQADVQRALKKWARRAR